MMNAVKNVLAELGVPRNKIKTEAFGTDKRNPATKSKTSTEIVGNVTFQVSGKVAPVPEGATILDAAENAGIYIDNACRSGTCGSCRIKLVSGKVKMAVEDALTDEEREQNYILACQSEISSDVTVEE
jgi:ferredoxin